MAKSSSVSRKREDKSCATAAATTTDLHQAFCMTQGDRGVLQVCLGLLKCSGWKTEKKKRKKRGRGEERKASSPLVSGSSAVGSRGQTSTLANQFNGRASQQLNKHLRNDAERFFPIGQRHKELLFRRRTNKHLPLRFKKREEQFTASMAEEPRASSDWHNVTNLENSL